MVSEPRAVRAQDVLSDEANTANFGGTEVRKGSIGAFIANAKTLDSLSPDDPGYSVVEAQLRELIPVVRAVGLFDVFAPRSETIAALVEEELTTER